MRVAYFTPSSFSTFNAGALRNMTLAKAISLGGHQVDIVHSGHPPDPAWYEVFPQGVRLVSGGTGREGPVERVRRFLLGPAAHGVLGNLEGIDLVVAYNPSPQAWSRLAAACSSSEIPIIADVTEWLAKDDFPRSVRSWYGPLYERHMERIANRVDAAIAVSSGLAGHFAAAGKPSIIVPPLHDSPMPYLRSRAAAARVLVSGSALGGSGKDGLSLALMLEALRGQPELRARIDLHVAGDVPTRDRRSLRQLESMSGVTFHGPLPYEEAQVLLRTMDAMVVLRNPSVSRLSLGFPSKVTEAVTNGVHVISNDFSDMATLFTPGADWTPVSLLSTDSLVQSLELFLQNLTAKDTVVVEGSSRFTPHAFSSDIADFLLARVQEHRG